MKEKNLKFSIIIPTYNIEKYISKCLNSILNQKYENLEILIIDDGSTDNTRSIIEMYGAKYTGKILIIETVHKGVASARNIGLKNASGDYIIFVDGDDYIFWNLFDYINNQKILYDCYVANFKCIWYDGVEKEIEYKKINNKDINQKSHYYILDTLYKKRTITAVWRFVVKANIAKKIKFTEGIVYEDEEWCSKMLLECSTYKMLPKVHYAYCRRKDSITLKKNIDTIKSIAYVCYSLIDMAQREQEKYKKTFLLRKAYLNAENCYYKARSVSRPRKPTRQRGKEKCVKI